MPQLGTKMCLETPCSTFLPGPVRHEMSLHLTIWPHESETSPNPPFISLSRSLLDPSTDRRVCGDVAEGRRGSGKDRWGNLCPCVRQDSQFQWIWRGRLIGRASGTRRDPCREVDLLRSPLRRWRQSGPLGCFGAARSPGSPASTAASPSALAQHNWFARRSNIGSVLC